MARRTTKKKGPTPEEEAKEFFEALDLIEEKKGIKKEYMMEKITQALVSAYKRDHEGVKDNIVVLTDPVKNSVRVIVRRDVVEEVDNPDTEISLEEARRALPHVQLGDVVSSEIKPKNFGRIAAQTARQVIIQGIREAERNMIYDEFVGKNPELLTVVVTRHRTPEWGAACEDRHRPGIHRSPADHWRAGAWGDLPGGRPHQGVCGGSPPHHPRYPGGHFPHPLRSGAPSVRDGSAGNL